jgi:hypothetical protein
MKRLLELMAEPSYQKVAGDRPLLYIFRPKEEWIAELGGPDKARQLMNEFRAAAIKAGCGNPYLVMMNNQLSVAKKMLDVFGAEALTCYAITGNGGMKGTPYKRLNDVARNFWERCANTGAEVVPLAMAGWDRRPRVEHPVPWEKYQKPNVGLEKYYATATPEELAGHIKQGMRWVIDNKETCPAQAVLIYAWNEHDEGGWLCPTLNPDGSANTKRLDAIAKMLKSFRE